MYLSKTPKTKIKIFGEEFPDFLDEFLKVLQFDPNEVWQKATFNRIKTMPTIVLGTTGMGKSTLLRFIHSNLDKYYKKNGGIVCIYTNQVTMTEFMSISLEIVDNPQNYGVKGRPSVVMMCYDDATSVEVKPEEIKRFFSMRHEMEEATGMLEGVIYTFFVTHDWFSLSKIFRRYADNLLVLSVPPLDEYSRQHLKRTIGEAAMRVLQCIRKRAMKEDKYKGNAIVKLPFTPDNYETDVGMLSFKPLQILPVSIRYGTSMNTYFDPVKNAVFIPGAKAIPETIEETAKRIEKQDKSNAERQQRWRDRQKIKKAKLKEAMAKQVIDKAVETKMVETKEVATV